MTCIAGLVDNGKVWIGGDSAGVTGFDVCIRSDSKVFKVGDFIFGFTTSFRMGQLLRFSFTPPKRHSDKDIMAYMVTDFIDGIRKCFKDGGFANKSNDVETGGTFLVGHEGRLFCIESDYQVGEPSDYYHAVGCGESYAKGSFYSTKQLSASKRIELALKSAEHHSAGVRGPFTILSI